MQRPMAAEAEAARESRAKVIAASGERNAAKALREAADIINSTSTAMQVRLIRLSRDLHNGNREINFLSHQKIAAALSPDAQFDCIGERIDHHLPAAH